MGAGPGLLGVRPQRVSGVRRGSRKGRGRGLKDLACLVSRGVRGWGEVDAHKLAGRTVEERAGRGQSGQGL